jgi:hypothetical protein
MAWRIFSYWAPVMVFFGFLATGGVFTPRPACSTVIWSLSAVLRMASSTTFAERIVGGRAS